jgi:hypothetical protein
MWVPLTGQRSTVTGPRSGSVGPRLGRIWAGLGWAGPATCQALVLPRHLSGFKNQVRAGELGSRWSRKDGPQSLNTVHGEPGPSSSLSPRLTVHRGHLVASLLLFPCFLFSAALSSMPPSAWLSRAAPSVALLPLVAVYSASLPTAKRSSSSLSSLPA